MISEKLKELSLTARLIYIFMCIENYLTQCFPERNWALLAKKMWQWTNVFWEEGYDVYSVVVPEYILEFSTYEETNRNSFDGKLSEEDYAAFVGLYDGITDGNGNSDFDNILRAPLDFGNICDSSAFAQADEKTLEIIGNVVSILKRNNVDIPSVERIAHFTADQKNGWGDFVNSEYLSVILN